MGIQNDRISQVYILQCIFPVFSADINHEVFCAQIAFFQKIPVRLYHTVNIALLGMYNHLLSRICMSHDSASVNHLKCPLFRDIGDHQTDLIRMGGQHDPYRMFRIYHTDKIVHLILPDFIRVLLHFHFDRLLHRFFIPGYRNAF